MSIIRCISPVNGEIYAEREAISLDAAKVAVARARAAQPGWASLPLETRIERVKAGIAALNNMKERVVEELAWQMGRPIRYGGEYGGINERADYMTSIAAEALAPLVTQEDAEFERRIEFDPHGVVFVIAPWNFPYMTALNSIVPALIAGNAVVLKHASQTPLVGERLAEAMHAGGVPEDVFQNLVLDHETTEALIKARSFGFVSFTGSVGGGAAIERACAGTFTGSGLELGGKDPAYVMEDADLDWAVDTLMDGAIFNSGQSCCSVERIYVHDRLYDDFVEKSVSWANALKLGNPLDQETTLGPMAQARGAKAVRAQIADAVSQGATTLIEPQNFPEDDGGTYIMPQILVGVDHSMRFMREETFGPALGIMKVSSDEEALKLMNDSDFGLTASLWTKDPERANALSPRIETGTVFMNRADYVDPAGCWTGVKDTGRGGAMSIIGYRAVTRPRTIHFRKVKS